MIPSGIETMSEFVVAVPQYRAAAKTQMGWKNSNLRTRLMRILRHTGVSPWPRLFHSIKLQEERASRHTELQMGVPAARGLRLAWQPTTDRPPELLAGYRG